MMWKDGKCAGGKMYAAHMVAKVLVVVGSLNWLAIGLGYFVSTTWSWNLVNMLLGSWPVVEAIVYIVVGLAAIMMCMGGKCCGAAGSCKAGSCKTEGSCKTAASCSTK